MHFLQDLAYIFCEIHRSWLQRKHEERFNWTILKIRAGELMVLITNGDCECRFAHNKCDIVPTSQESIEVSNQLSWMLVLTQNAFQEKKTTKPTSLRCDNYFYNNAFTVAWTSSCHFSGWRKQQPSGRNPCKVTRHPEASRSWFQKSPFQATIGVWTLLTLILSFTGKSASCRAEQQSQRDAEESPLEELSTKQIKTNVCDKQLPFVKSAHSKDHIFSQTRPQFLFVLSHHCFETW